MEREPRDRPNFDQIASHPWMRKMEQVEGDYYVVERKSYMGGRNPFDEVPNETGYNTGNAYLSPHL